jgi:hypothetical protein
LQEAVDMALEESSGLIAWERTHPSPLVSGASYSANQTDTRVMEYTWNITFADEPGNFSDWEVWGPTNAYQVNVTKRVTSRIIGGDLVETFIDSEYGPRWGYAPVSEDDMGDELLTLASSEDIWANIQSVADEAYPGLSQEVDFTEAGYSFGVGGLDAIAAGFGMDLLDTLAGITIPNAEVSWTMQLGGVWEAGTTTIVAVDAQTGRMVYVTHAEGPQSLSFILGNL